MHPTRRRPLFHFTPPQGWINDPNGLVYQAGEYHLFYQHHPHDTLWGPMHWGHAVSGDLLHWQHLPIALYPDELGAIFSGSAVVDHRNTAGFGAGTLVAIFTHDGPHCQAQSLAYSTDQGRTWTKYPGNPVLEPPPGCRDFRDPKVFWYGEEDQGHWVMALAAGRAIRFYTSPDLKHWQAGGSFTVEGAEAGGVWETPELLHLPVDDGPEAHWVLALGVDQDGPAGGSGQAYCVGHFDGHIFHPLESPPTLHWADHGPDFYAGQAWNNAPERRRIWVGWMNNWIYARQIPATTWRGALSVPRELGLLRTEAGLRLVQRPVRELARLRTGHHRVENRTIPGDGVVPLGSGSRLEIQTSFRVDPSSAAEAGLRLVSGPEEYTEIGFHPGKNRLWVDRRRSGTVDFHPAFAARHSAPLWIRDGQVHLHILVDTNSVEVFAGGGLTCLTAQIFPWSGTFRVEAFARGGSGTLECLDLHRLG